MTDRNESPQPQMHWTRHAQRRVEIAALDRELDPQEFHILGGGVAGLVAAYEILRLRPRGSKHRVALYEATSRVGGRINTARLGEKPPEGEPDTRPYFERGAMRIPTSHDYTWAYASESGLKRRRFLNDERSLDFGGKVYPAADARAVAKEQYGFELAPDRSPGDLFRRLVMVPELEGLDRAYGSRSAWAEKLVAGNISGDGLQRIDRMTLEQVLEERLGRLPGRPKNFLADLLFPGLVDRALLYFVRNTVTNFGDLYELCETHPGGIVTGGMDLLIAGLRKKIEELDPSCIQLGRVVTQIKTDPNGEWEVLFEDGRVVKRGGSSKRHLLCTLPFSLLRHQDMKLVGFEGKIAAIRGISYVPATKVALHVRERFWETRSNYKGGRSLADKSITQTYFPNDHSRVEEIGAAAEETHAAYDLYTQPSQTLSEAEAASLAACEAGKGPWLMLSSYTLGAKAVEMGKKPPLATVPDLERVFGKLDSLVEEKFSETWHWDDKPFVRGAVTVPAPLDVSRFYRDARSPYCSIFFAGDHLSPDPGWIQGSAYSALYAVEHIQRTLLGRGEPKETDHDGNA